MLRLDRPGNKSVTAIVQRERHAAPEAEMSGGFHPARRWAWREPIAQIQRAEVWRVAAWVIEWLERQIDLAKLGN